MKKIIFVSGIQIFPPESGGQLRSANFCRSLAKLGFCVEIYSFSGRKNDYLKSKKSSEEKICDHISEYTNRNPLWGAIQFLFYKANLPPLWLTWLTQLYIPRALKKKIKNAESLLIDFPYLYPIANNSSAALRVNTHNAEFELYAGRKFIGSIVKKIEVESFKKAEIVLFCNDQDAKKFTDIFPQILSKARLLPNGVDSDDFIFNENDRLFIRNNYNISNDQRVYLFTGSHYLPNIKALEFLVNWSHQNAPFLIEEKIVILVVGTVCETLYDSSYLKIAGKVPEIKPYFWASDFGLNPVLEGSGTNVKMIEFLAARLPVLTTAFGARGLKLVHQETCYYFEQANFLSVLKISRHTDQSKINEMAAKALVENQQNIDMSDALKNLSIKW